MNGRIRGKQVVCRVGQVAILLAGQLDPDVSATFAWLAALEAERRVCSPLCQIYSDFGRDLRRYDF